jgi:hypothetical protein
MCTAVWFAASSAVPVGSVIYLRAFGGDALIYAAAARAWLEGANPWATGAFWGTSAQVFYYAAPPPTLLFFVPFAYAPSFVTITFWIVLDAALALLVLRHLRLPWWWITWAPLASAIAVGNPEPLMLALLILGRERLAWLAPIVKPYALLPLVAESRMKSLALALGLMIVTLPIVPWMLYIDSLSAIGHVLEKQALVVRSAAAIPVLIPFVLLALVCLGRSRAGWLAFPALVPYSQVQYAVIALPRSSPLIAIAATIPLAGAIAWAVIAEAALLIARRLRARSERAARAV